MITHPIKGGDIVAYRKPFANGIDERHERMVVLEDSDVQVKVKEDGYIPRVVVQSMYCYSCKKVCLESIGRCECNLIQPTQLLAKKHLVNANQDSEELAMAMEDIQEDSKLGIKELVDN